MLEKIELEQNPLWFGIRKKHRHSVFAGTGIGESGDGAIHCVDAATGKALWASETVNSLSATPTLSQDGRELYIGSNAFFVDAFYAFATKNGALRWTFNITTLPTEVIGSALRFF